MVDSNQIRRLIPINCIYNLITHNRNTHQLRFIFEASFFLYLFIFCNSRKQLKYLKDRCGVVDMVSA
jgi:hypothetical protein